VAASTGCSVSNRLALGGFGGQESTPTAQAEWLQHQALNWSRLGASNLPSPQLLSQAEVALQFFTFWPHPTLRHCLSRYDGEIEHVLGLSSHLVGDASRCWVLQRPSIDQNSHGKSSQNAQRLMAASRRVTICLRIPVASPGQASCSLTFLLLIMLSSRPSYHQSSPISIGPILPHGMTHPPFTSKSSFKPSDRINVL
jgi:hypothetical protein